MLPNTPTSTFSTWLNHGQSTSCVHRSECRVPNGNSILVISSCGIREIVPDIHLSDDRHRNHLLTGFSLFRCAWIASSERPHPYPAVAGVAVLLLFLFRPALPAFPPPFFFCSALMASIFSFRWLYGSSTCFNFFFCLTASFRTFSSPGSLNPIFFRLAYSSASLRWSAGLLPPHPIFLLSSFFAFVAIIICSRCVLVVLFLFLTSRWHCRRRPATARNTTTGGGRGGSFFLDSQSIRTAVEVGDHYSIQDANDIKGKQRFTSSRVEINTTHRDSHTSQSCCFLAARQFCAAKVKEKGFSRNLFKGICRTIVGCWHMSNDLVCSYSK